MNIIKGLIILAPLVLPTILHAACDCGSADASTPCTGQSISITVTAGTPNGGTAVNNVYNWSFNSSGKDARCGQFANGDYWVAPADGETTVTLTGISSSSHPSHISADENPTTEAIGLLSAVKTYGNYSASENIILALPKIYSSATSIVAAIERDASREGGCGTASIVGGCADSYNVLTVLDSVPPLAGSETLRPNMNGSYKELLSFSDFDLTRVPRKAFLTGTDAAGLANITRRWSHSIETLGLNTTANNGGDGFSEGGRAFRAHTLIDDYGAGTAATWYNDLMVLFSDAHTDQEKKRPLAAMLAYGLDLYHAIYDPPAGVTRYWGSGATQHTGRFMPAVLLAALAKDSKYANNVKTASAHLRDHVSSGPLELAQVHTGTNGPVWGDIPALSGVNFLGAYWNDAMRSQCFDYAPEMEKWDYYVTGAWKSFSLPIGTLTSGSGLHFTFLSDPGSPGVGDLKIKNVTIDGEPINFNTVTMQNYAGGTNSGTISGDGTEYTVPSGLFVKKTTAETYTLTAESVLAFDWYQDTVGSVHGIGFETDSTYSDDPKMMVQISGSRAAKEMYQKGCLPAIGSKTMYDPHGYIDGPPNKPATSYFGSSLGVQRAMVATMALMPEVYDVVNYPLLVQYVDRTTSHGVQAGNDPCVTPDSRENITVCDPYRNTGCLYYGVTWGPHVPANPESECIATPTPPYTNSGRFDRVDGRIVGITYGAGQVEENWGAIRALLGVPPARSRRLSLGGRPIKLAEPGP